MGWTRDHSSVSVQSSHPIRQEWEKTQSTAAVRHQTAPQPPALSFSSSVPETFHHSCDIGVLRPQYISSKIGLTFHYTLVFALSIGALHVAMFTAAPTANMALFMIQKKTRHFLFSDC